MSGVTLVWRGFLGALRMHLRLYTLWQARIVTTLAGPAVTAAIAVMVLRAGAHGPDDYLRVMVGAGLAAMWGSVLGTAMLTLRREREWYGTLALLTAVPTPLGAIFGGYLVAEAAAGLAGVGVGIGTGWLLLGGKVALAAPAGFAVSLLVAAVAIAAVALPIMPMVVLAPVLTRWINGLDYPVWVLGGFLFPLALLPGWARPLGEAMPVYWATEALHRAAAGDGPATLAPYWGAALALCLAFLALALAGLRLAMSRTRRVGALVSE